MSLIKSAIQDAAFQDQPKPAFSEQQWHHLLSVIQDAITDPNPNITRTNLQNLHHWLRRIKSESAPGA
jgi:hypothetical protein